MSHRRAFTRHLYILDGKTPVPEPDLSTWARWFEDADRIVAHTVRENVSVSTVFLGLDHSFHEGPPILFETMVFRSGQSGDDMARYSTWEEAEKGHAEMVKLALSKRYQKA